MNTKTITAADVDEWLRGLSPILLRALENTHPEDRADRLRLIIGYVQEYTDPIVDLKMGDLEKLILCLEIAIPLVQTIRRHMDMAVAAGAPVVLVTRDGQEVPKGEN